MTSAMYEWAMLPSKLTLCDDEIKALHNSLPVKRSGLRRHLFKFHHPPAEAGCQVTPGALRWAVHHEIIDESAPFGSAQDRLWRLGG
jgi:hypothetical protein